MRKELRENVIAITALGVGVTCLFTGNCQAGIAVLLPATIYQAGSVVKDMKNSKINKTEE